MKKWIFLILAALLIIVLAFLFWLGVFSSVTVKETKTGPYVMAYQDYVGGYSTTGKVFAVVNDTLCKSGINPARGIGIYLDDPSKVPAEKQRSEIGCILEGSELKKLEQAKKILKVKNIGIKDSLIVELPIKNVLSYMIGPMKAYPALTKLAMEKKLKAFLVFEIYDMPAKKALYIMQYTK